MAEAIFNAGAPPGWRAISAGTEPEPAPDRHTDLMLRELGLALPAHSPQGLTEAMVRTATIRITMGCLERPSCPSFLRRADPTDWALPDPVRMDEAGFRAVRDEVRRRVDELVAQLRRRSPPRNSPGSGAGPGTSSR